MNDEIVYLAKRVEELEAALPKTADGVTVVPGMTVYVRTMANSRKFRTATVGSVENTYWVERISQLTHCTDCKDVYYSLEDNSKEQE